MLYGRTATGGTILEATAVDAVVASSALQHLSSLLTKEDGPALDF